MSQLTKNSLLSIVFSLLFSIAQSQPVFYEYEELGWSCSYPENWNIQTAEEIERIEKLGRAAMGDAIPDSIPADYHTNLLWLTKDAYNSLTSSIQPYNPEDGDFKESQYQLFDVILGTYQKQGLFTQSHQGIMIIDDLEFVTVEVDIYLQADSRYIMSQFMLARLFNDTTTLTISANWNDEDNKRELMNLLQNSTFSVRE